MGEELMELQQCWTQYQKAEKLMASGQWPEAHCLFKQVLLSLPNHILAALEDKRTRPCQFVCLLGGITDSAISQSQILHKLGHHQQAFDILNQNHAFMQFLSLEQSDLAEVTRQVIQSNGETLLRHLEAFCSSQRSAKWMLEFSEIERAHYHYCAAKPYSYWQPNSHH